MTNKALEVYELDKNKFIVKDDPILQLYMAYTYTIKGEALRLLDKYDESMESLHNAFNIFENINFKRNAKYGYLIYCMA